MQCTGFEDVSIFIFNENVCLRTICLTSSKGINDDKKSDKDWGGGEDVLRVPDSNNPETIYGKSTKS